MKILRGTMLIQILICFSLMVSGKEYHVSVHGKDKNPGTEKKPFLTVEAAQKAVRESGLLGQERCEVIIHEGVYRFQKPLLFSIKDSGAEGAEVTYRAAEGEEVVFSSAEVLNINWTKAENGVFKALLKSDKAIDQLIVNGELQHMARYPNYKEAIIDSKSANRADHKVIPFNGGAANAWSKEKANGWDNPKGAFMHAVHRALWGDIHYQVTGKKANGELEFQNS